MKHLMRLSLLLVAALFSVSVVAQTVTGTVLDGETGEALPGASVLEVGTTNGAISDMNGAFSLKAVNSSGTVKISYIGYTTQELPFDGSTVDLGQISLAASIEIDEVVVVGVGVIDVAKDRETPVAVSTITMPEIIAKSGNQEFPDIMKNTPSVYVASQAGGYGDSRINIRGFSQENLALLFNGQPVNGMEDGKVYWSNWQGLSEIATAVQIQRGLGSSKLAISSVGATINVVTKATDMVEGGRVSALMGNDNYMKYVASYSTGLSESGWGASFLLSHWQGNGYNDGTQGQGQTYFFSVGYQPNDKHKFNLSVTGAPQWHNQNYTKELGDYDLDGDGEITNEEQRFNDNWGYKDGEVFSWRTNFYHKPVANLNWDWNISNKSTLSTVFYASTGSGGGTGPYGDYGIYNFTRDENGQVDFDGIIASNSGIAPNSDGKIIGFFENDGSRYGVADFAARRASMNQHKWIGAVTNYKYELSENLAFNIGMDLRTYYGSHFRLVDNLLGMDGFIDENVGQAGFQATYPGGALYSQQHTASPYMFWTNRNSEIDDKLDYYNTERISYQGLFGQLEYKTEQLSAFMQAAVSNQGYQRFDYFTYYDAAEQPSEKLQHLGYNLKAGGNYNINEMHNVFVNAGYYSRQPFFDDLYMNYANDVNPDVGNEKVLGFEVGYGMRSDMIDVDLNGYYTNWSDRQIRKTGDYNGDDVRDDVALFENVAEMHVGVELEFRVKPITNLEVGGFASIGNWVYGGNVEAMLYDVNRNPITTGSNVLYLDDVKVGNAAQTTFGLLLDYKIAKGFSVDMDWRYYDRLYAEIDPGSFGVEDHEGSLELPSFNLLDGGVSYKLYLKDRKAIVFRGNVNNILNKQFISQSDTNIHEEDGASYWNGVNMENEVYFGNGRTWNFSVAYKF